MSGLLQIFNRYRERGGEEKSAQRIFDHGSEVVEMDRLWWDTRDWDDRGKFEQFRRLFYNSEAVDAFRKKAKEMQADAAMFHNVFPIGSPGIYKAALDMELPVIQYVHNFRPFSVSGTLWTGKKVAEGSLRGSWQASVLKSAVFSLVLRRLHRSGWLKSVKLWIAISEFMRQTFIGTGIPAEDVVTLRHVWDAMEQPPDWQDEGYYLCLARLLSAKGVTSLLDAWSRMEEEWGNDCPRLLVAGTGPCEDEVRKVAERSGCVEFVGFVACEKKRDLIVGCRAMMAPSVWWEPLGLVTYEAYDHAKPMIASATGGLTETVDEGVSGFLHRPGDVDHIMEARTEAERREMGQRGREWLLREADPARWKREFKKIVSPVMGAR